MSAGKLNITVEQGASFYLKMTLKNSLDTPIDLSGESFTGQIRITADGNNIAATLECTILNQTTNTGQVEVRISAANTSLIQTPVQRNQNKINGFYVYDIERTLLDGITKQRILEGIVTVTPEVTK